MHHFRFSQRTVAAVLGVLAVAYTVQAYRIPEFAAVQVPVQPGTLPRGLGLLLIVLCLALFLQKPAPKTTEPSDTAGTTTSTATGTTTGTAKAAAVSVAAATEHTENTASGTSTPRPTLGRLADARLELAVLLGAIVLYVLLFEPLGFVPATALFVTGTAWYLGFGRHWVNALVGVGVAAGLYLGMSEGLDVALPTGVLPF